MSQLGEPIQEVIQVIQEHLEDALVGEIQGVAIVSLRADGNGMSAWQIVSERDIGLLYMALDALKRRMQHAADETFGDEDDEPETEA